MGPHLRVAIAAACLFVTGAAAAAASPVPESLNPDELESQSQLGEAGQYAVRHNLSEEDAKTRLALIERSGGLLEAATEAAGTQFARARFVHDPRLAIAVAVTTPQAAEAVGEALIESPVPVEIDVVEKSLRELETFTDERVNMWLKKFPEIEGIDIAGERGAVELVVSADATTREQIATELGAEAREAGVALIVQRADSPSTDGRRGGLDTTSCTVGFSVRRVTDGQLGIATAGHCGDFQQWRSIDDGPWQPTDHRGALQNAYADLQWHTIDVAPQYFFFGPETSSARDVRGTFSRPELDGLPVCHRGKTTEYSCGDVTSITYRPTYTDACPGTTCDAAWPLVEGSTLECYPGDSGGPFFNGWYAAGIYKGQSSSGTTAAGCASAWFTPIGRLSNLGQGFEVMQSP